jgi:site-specific DNA-methyltransferase (adenine-specific)
VSLTPYYEDSAVRLFHGDCREILPQLEAVDHVITDPPYSGRTHKGHDSGARPGFDGADRKALGYEPWTLTDVGVFVPLMCGVARGWVAVMTDHVLAMPIQAAMESAGRYAFAPLPWYAPGSRVRLCGDGPSSWTAWIVVCRTAAQRSWGTLPGGYMQRGESMHMGGKPEELMLALVSDYSRPGDIVCDPFAGSGTTLVAAKRLGRKAIGIEQDESACENTARRLSIRFDGIEGGLFATEQPA